MLINAKLLVLIFLFIGLINAGLIKENSFGKKVFKGDVKCSNQCSDSSRFGYRVGSSYTYDFATKSSIFEDKNELHKAEINGHAKITVQSKCEHVLKLENVNIKNVDKATEEKLIKELESHNLPYSFNDGIINNVCPLTEEVDWALNIKKAILSSLQFTPESDFKGLSSIKAYERDVLGDCETLYKSQNEDDNSLTWVKTKQLGTCKERAHISSPIFGNSKLVADIAIYYSSLIMKNEYKCKYTIKNNGIIESAKCVETFDSGDIFKHKISSLSELTVKFNSENPVHYPQLTGEYYKDTLTGHKVNKDLKKAKLNQNLNLRTAIENFCASIKNTTLDLQSIKEYRNLVNTLKVSSYDQIKAELVDLQKKNEASIKNKEHNNLSNNECCPSKLFKLFLDGLTNAKTDATLKILVNDVIPNNFFYDEKSSLKLQLRLADFYISLAYYPDATDETLRSVLPLLKIKNQFSRNALLSVTSLARNICQYKKDCHSQEIEKLANQLAESIPDNCGIKSEQSSSLIEILKGLQNLPILSEKTIKKLLPCVKNSDVPIRIKLDVIKVFANKQKETRSSDVNKALKDVLSNKNENREARIYAFNALKGCFTNEDAKYIQEIISNENNELTNYIISKVQHYKYSNSNKCQNKFFNFVKENKLNYKTDSLTGKSSVTITNLLPFTSGSELIIKTDLIYSEKSKQPTVLNSKLKYACSELINIEVRSETGSNALLGLAKIENIINGLHELIKSVTSKTENNKSNIINEYANRIVSELLKSIKDVDISLSVGERIIVFISNKDEQPTNNNPGNFLKLGLASILGLDFDTVFDIQTASGISVIIDTERTILVNFALYNLQKVDYKKTTFEVTPNLVLGRLITVGSSLPHDNFVFEKEDYLTTNFGLKGSNQKLDDRVELRVKLSRPKTEILTYRSNYQYRVNDQVKVFQSNEENQEFCLDTYLPTKKLLGYSICLKSHDNVNGLILEKYDDSNLLITYVNNDKKKQELIFEHENSINKRKFYISSKIANNEHSLNVGVENPLVNGQLNLISKENKIIFNVKAQNEKILDLELDKEVIEKNNETEYITKLKTEIPSLIKPITGKFLVQIEKNKNSNVKGEFVLNEKTRLASIEFKNEKDQSEIKTKLGLKLFTLSEKQLINLNYDLNRKSDSINLKSSLEYLKSFRTSEQEKFNLDSYVFYSKKDVFKYTVKNNFQSSQFPILNHNYEHKFVYKFLEHIENDFNIEINALGKEDERKLRFTHLSTLTKKGDHKYSTENLIHILIKKLNLNREYTYKGNYDVSNPFWLIDDNLKITDLASSTQLLTVSIKLDGVDVSNGKYKFLVNYDCSKHGKFTWDEDLTYDKQNKDVSTKIILTVFRTDQNSPIVYNGEYKANDISFAPNKMELILKKENDKTNFLTLKRDFTNPNEKIFTYVEYKDKRVFDFEAKYSASVLENLHVKAFKLGEIEFSTSQIPEGKKVHLKLKTELGYEQTASVLYSKNKFSLNFDLNEKKNKLASLELFLSNSKTAIKTYHDIESGSLLVKLLNYQFLYKREGLTENRSLLLELQDTNSKKKITFMGVKEKKKIGLLGKFEQNDIVIFELDSAYNKKSTSVVTIKTQDVDLNLYIDPYSYNSNDWNLIKLEITRKDATFKHLSLLNIKKNNQNKRSILININSSGKSENHDYKRIYELESNEDFNNFKLNIKFFINNELLHGLNLNHEFTSDKDVLVFIKNSFKLIIKKKLISSHISEAKLIRTNKNYEGNFSFDLKSNHPKLDGIKISSKGKCFGGKSSEFNAIINVPALNFIHNIQYIGKNSLEEKFLRELIIETENTKLNYKDSILLKIDLIDKYDIYLKFDSKANTGHNLENKEIHIYSKNGENSFNLIGPYGWNANSEVKVTKNSFAYSINIKKRGRIIVLINSKIDILAKNRTKRSINLPDFTLHTIFGFNGNPKVAEEFCTFKNDQIEYKLTTTSYKIQANLLKEPKKHTLNVQVCPISDPQNCAVFDLLKTKENNQKKVIVKFNYGKGDETFNCNLEYNIEKLDSGEQKGTISGEINEKKIVGKLYYRPKKESTIEITFPSRVVLFKKEVISEKNVKYSFYPNYEKDKKLVHSITFKVDNKNNDSISERAVILEIQHPAFQVPLKFNLESFIETQNINGYQKYKNVNLLSNFEYSSNANKNLHFVYNFNSKDSYYKTLRFYRLDSKIDFGCSINLHNQIGSKYFRNYTCHWVNEEGKKLVLNDYFGFDILNNKQDLIDITFKVLKHSILLSIDADGKFNLDIKNRFFNGLIDFNNFKKKLRYEINYKDLCFNVNKYTPPKESYKNSRTIETCINKKSDPNNLFLIDVKDQRLLKSKKFDEIEKLHVSLSKAEEKQLHFIFRLDLDLFGEFVVFAVGGIEDSRELFLNKTQIILDELKFKGEQFKSILVEDLYKPWKKYEQEAIIEFVNEINPKLAAKLKNRIKRSIEKNQKTWYELLFNVKVVKFNYEEGEIDVYFTPHPSLNGLKQLIKQNFQTLFK